MRQALLATRPQVWPCSPCLHQVDTVQQVAEHAAVQEVAKQKLASCNNPVNAYVSSEMDPYYQDDLTREILSMPFGPNDLLFSDPIVDFVVSLLVVLLQMHWWHHCTSCFKQSRCTKGAHICRYQFPQERSTIRVIGPSSIQLVRPLGHEYVNGFNDVIMRTFKCNHDIQIMIGGSEMAERMYYACKYTTKDQHKVECKIALALAALDKRIHRDKESEASGNPLSEETKCHRRLTSHLYHMTNKHETAGPLCALYILRQSCAYQSHVYKPLPLRQMLNQLLQSRNTLCELAAVSNKCNNDESDDDGISLASSSSNDSAESLYDSDYGDEDCDSMIQNTSLSSDKAVQKYNNDDSVLSTSPSSDNRNVDNNNSSMKAASTDNETIDDSGGCKRGNSNIHFRIVGPLDDYLFRPDPYAAKSVNKFVSSCFRGIWTEITDAGRLFKTGHPLSHSKCVGEHRFANIPVLSAGMRLPLFED